ncbi:MAG: Gfo/Idh/MocA family oxidoreductase [Acidobacteria bacterium]|nr:Gfo/Idh/MocA family oxidoreductase [Acidobacteriota bacterium]
MNPGSLPLTQRLSRREFNRKTAGLAGAAAAFSIVPAHVRGGPGHTAPGDKLTIAGIGVGGMGFSNLRSLESEAIVALCDVDLEYAAETIAHLPDATVYTDYREMLENQEDLDGVVIATPDHTHAVISLAAMRAGKHVFCQKPLTHDVYESRLLAQVARETGVVTQMGIQGHSSDGVRAICEWIWAGLIGEVREVDAWCSLSYYPWGHAGWSSEWSERPSDTPAVPEGLDWDLWIGPAPMRPYHRAYHPLTWRCWWDFGSGMMGDRGAHTLDPVVWALGLDAPTSIDATSCGNTPEVHPLSAIVTYEFPARGDLPPVTVRWYEGTRPPRPKELEDGRRMPDEGGALIKGSEGTLMCGVYGDSPRIIPEEKMRTAELPEPSLPRVEGSHEMEWVRACKRGEPAGADFAYSGPLTEICQLGNVAQRADTRILWDAASLRVTNLPEAQQYVRYPAREGWQLPELGEVP